VGLLGGSGFWYGPPMPLGWPALARAWVGDRASVWARPALLDRAHPWFGSRPADGLPIGSALNGRNRPVAVDPLPILSPAPGQAAPIGAERGEAGISCFRYSSATEPDRRIVAATERKARVV
jgi:hypothetical protein